jgi:hypothetical protein
VSVLTETDRHVVAAAIARARTPRPRMTRTQALAPRPRPRRKAVEKSKPLLFVGLCGYCGAPALFHQDTCEAHTDLPALDGRTSAVVTNPTFGVGNHAPAVPGTADASEGRPDSGTQSTAVARTTFPGSASDGSQENRT